MKKENELMFKLSQLDDPAIWARAIEDIIGGKAPSQKVIDTIEKKIALRAELDIEKAKP